MVVVTLHGVAVNIPIKNTKYSVKVLANGWQAQAQIFPDTLFQLVKLKMVNLCSLAEPVMRVPLQLEKFNHPMECVTFHMVDRRWHFLTLKSFVHSKLF
jgi:hypothetical protein